MHTSPDASLTANVSRLLILPSNRVMREIPGGCGVFAYNGYHWFPCELFIFPGLRSLHQPAVSRQAKCVGLGGRGFGQEVQPLPHKLFQQELAEGRVIENVAEDPKAGLEEQHSDLVNSLLAAWTVPLANTDILTWEDMGVMYSWPNL